MPSPLPNLIIAGVNKAGTTSLYAYLAQHPAFGASAIKETCHFLSLRYGEPMPAIEDYHKQFAAVTEKPVRFESTPGYFFGGQPLIDGLKDTLGDDLKIVLMFREPVGRLISFFNFKKSTLELPADLTLADYVTKCRALNTVALTQRENNPWFGVEGGKYADYLPPWVDAFGDRLKVLFTDDLHADPRGVLRGLCTFMEADTAGVDAIELTRENRGTNFRHPALQRAALSVNKAGESFWRAHPRIKRTLRGLYYRLNGKAFHQPDDPATLGSLRTLYAPYNARFAEQLRDAGVTHLPDWVSARKAAAP